MPERACAQCGQQFEYKPSQPRRECCSTSCAAKLRNARLKVEGRLYHPVKPRRGETNPCETCGSPVYRNKSQAASGQGRFCSSACRDKAQGANGVVKPCAVCGREMRHSPSQSHVATCSRECHALGRIKRPTGEIYNGRPIKTDTKGYRMVWEPSHPNKTMKGWQYEHRLIVERMVGRYLLPGEQVDHVNRDKQDNRPENLQVLSQIDHAIKSAAEFRSDIEQLRAIALAYIEAQRDLLEYRRLFGPLPGKE